MPSPKDIERLEEIAGALDDERGLVGEQWKEDADWLRDFAKRPVSGEDGRLREVRDFAERCAADHAEQSKEADDIEDRLCNAFQVIVDYANVRLLSKGVEDGAK